MQALPHVPEGGQAPSFAALRNRHAGETMIVCGCGHSLKWYADDHPFITIGVNDVGRKFTPDYLVVLNPPKDFKDDRWYHTRNTRSRAVFSQLKLSFPHSRLVPFRLGEHKGIFGDDPHTLPYTRNSPYVALALAAHLGATRIGLLGVDFTQHHFFKNDGTHPLSRDLNEINREYQNLYHSLRARGVQVYNLSPESRLRCLPRMSWERFVNQAPKTIPLPRSEAMKVTVEYKNGNGLVARFLNRLSSSLSRCGLPIKRIPYRSQAHHGNVSFVWNGRHVRSRGVTICCEHGWLPTTAYQMGLGGVNAGAHYAPYRWRGQTPGPETTAALGEYLQMLRRYQLRRAGKAQRILMPKRFLLVPFQLEGDSNIIYHAPSDLRRMQNLIDYVTTQNPDLPVVFKQHPVDARKGSHRHLGLTVHRPQDQILAHGDVNIHHLLASKRCRGLISINSNSLHDALLWNVPAVALGHNVWPRAGVSPFLRRIPSDLGQLGHHFHSTTACRHAYLIHLLKYQWTLEDLDDTPRLASFLEECLAYVNRSK